MENIMQLMQLILSFGNICIIGYAFFKFMNKPRTDLEQQVNTHEVEIQGIKQSLLKGNDRFRNQSETNEVLIRSTLALVEFEIQYCITEKKGMTDDLKASKEELHKFLSNRR